MSAAMARTRKPRRAVPLEVRADHGTAIRLARGDLDVSDRPDPENPNRTVRRASVRVHYTHMGLTDPQMEAANRLCVQVERAGGGMWKPDGVVVSLHPSQRGHPAEWQLAATRDVENARVALGKTAWAVVWACVVENRPMSAEAVSGHARAVLTGRLLAALDRLAEHWRMGG